MTSIITVMSKTTSVLLAILLCAAAILPVAAQSTSTIAGVFDYDKAKQVVKNINNIRQSIGCGAFLSPDGYYSSCFRRSFR